MFETAIAGSLPKPEWLAETNKLWPKWMAEGDNAAILEKYLKEWNLSVQ